MKPIALVLVGLHLAVVPCFADVIPTRRVERNAAAEQKVKARLEQLGVSPQDADRQVSDLSARDTAYFADNPDRVQSAAGLYWYEWLGGLVFVAVIVAIVAIRVWG